MACKRSPIPGAFLVGMLLADGCLLGQATGWPQKDFFFESHSDFGRFWSQNLQPSALNPRKNQ